VDLGIRCYEISRAFPREERYGLTAQIRAAAVSIAANIAEGNGRRTRGEYLNNLSAARGSLREVDTHLEFALRLNYNSQTTIDGVRKLLDEVACTAHTVDRGPERKREPASGRFPVPSSPFPLLAG
jgi:four helix bundle protein